MPFDLNIDKCGRKSRHIIVDNVRIFGRVLEIKVILIEQFYLYNFFKELKRVDLILILIEKAYIILLSRNFYRIENVLFKERRNFDGFVERNPRGVFSSKLIYHEIGNFIP